MDQSKKSNHVGSALTRRNFLTGGAVLGGSLLAGCTSTPSMPNFPRFNSKPLAERGIGIERQNYAQLYGPLPNEKFPIPAIDLDKVPSKYYRRSVVYPSNERVGTVIVDTNNFYLYLIEGNNRAMRYGVGLGRAGFEWEGRARIQWKQEWPKWTPPEEMIERQPELEKYSAENGGMPPGLNNPLGARALYIFQDGVDTLYRIHGTPEYWTIGKAVSSGCVRMMNQDVIDLYNRAKTRVPIIVL